MMIRDRITEFGHDGRVALRMLARTPGYTVVVVGSAALAICVISTVFAAIQTVLLRPTGLRSPERLVIGWETDPAINRPSVAVSYLNAQEWASVPSLAKIAVVSSTSDRGVLRDRGEPVKVSYAAVSAPFFEVLGVRPILGRDFVARDELPSGERVAILSYPFWQSTFGASPQIIGRTIVFENRPHTIVGIMPNGFSYPAGVALWLPATPRVYDLAAEWGGPFPEIARGVGLFHVVGRLSATGSTASAAAELDAVVRRQVQAKGRVANAPVVVIASFVDTMIGPARRILVWLFVAAWIVLIVACANISALLLTRAADRRREHAIRVALGGDRRHLIKGWLFESAWLAGLAGALGLIGVHWLSRLIARVGIVGVERLSNIGVDWTVTSFAFLVGAVAIAVCTVLPAWSSVVFNPREALTQGVTSTNRRWNRGRTALVVAQIAGAVVLLLSAGPVVRSFMNVQRVDIGFDPTNVLTLDVEPERVSLEDWRAWYHEFLQQVQTLPDVVSVGAVYLRPLGADASGWNTSVILEGQPDTLETAKNNPRVHYEAVTPGYFRAMRIPLLRGRMIEERDDETSRRVVLVSELTAARLWPGQDPIGKRLSMPVVGRAGIQSVWHTVVGLVKNVPYHGIEDVRLDVYEPYGQAHQMVRHVVVLTSGDPVHLAPAVVAQAKALDDQVVISNIDTMSAVVGRATGRWRFTAWMFALCAGVALLLGTVGLFTLLTLDSTRRRREFAVRLAFGARASDIVGLVLTRAMVVGAAGILLGTVLASLLSGTLRTLLYGVTPLDPITIQVVAVLVAALVAVASYVPARRASRVQPQNLLKGD